MKIYSKRVLIEKSTFFQEVHLLKVSDSITYYKASTHILGTFYEFFYMTRGIDTSTYKLNDRNVVSRTFWEF